MPSHGLETELKLSFCFYNQENGGTMRLYPLLWKVTIIVVHFAHASPWLFIIPITKSFLDFVHILSKCGSRTEATYSSPEVL